METEDRLRACASMLCRSNSMKRDQCLEAAEIILSTKPPLAEVIVVGDGSTTGRG
jgi:hypothetical protein